MNRKKLVALLVVLIVVVFSVAVAPAALGQEAKAGKAEANTDPCMAKAGKAEAKC